MNARFEQTVQIPRSAFTLEGFRDWIKSEHFPRAGFLASFLGDTLWFELDGEHFGVIPTKGTMETCFESWVRSKEFAHSGLTATLQATAIQIAIKDAGADD